MSLTSPFGSKILELEVNHAAGFQMGMSNWYTDLTSLDRVFVFCAFVGILLFIARLVLQIFGGDHGTDSSDGGDVGDIGDGHDTDVSFKFMSLHGVTIFLVMFGLVGHALIADGGTGSRVAIAGAFGAGILALFVMAKIYMLMNRLQSSGNVDVNNAVGAEGTVYLTIPAGGSGQVQVSFQEKQHVLDAIHEGNEELKTGKRVVVTGVRGTSTLIVVKQESPENPA